MLTQSCVTITADSQTTFTLSLKIKKTIMKSATKSQEAQNAENVKCSNANCTCVNCNCGSACTCKDCK